MKKASQNPLVWVIVAFVFLTAGVFIGRFTYGDIPLDKFVHSNSEVQDAQKTSPNDTARSKININTADLSTLTILPGIGEGLAQRIIDYREENGPYKTVDELLDVDGLGKSRVDKLREYVTVGG